MKILTSTDVCKNKSNVYYPISLSFSQNIKGIKLLIICFLLYAHSIAQKSSPQLEINPFVRLDKYPKFSYKTGGVTRDELAIKGTSWGIDFSYKIPLKKNIAVKAGLGYYRYTFNKITHFNEIFGHGNKRIIDFPSPDYLLFATDKYWYNTISINAAIEKKIIAIKNTRLVGGINLSNHITYSQYYHIPVSYPVGPKNGRYSRNKVRYFGTSASVYFSLLQKVGKIRIGPSVIIPICDTWKQDVIFPEESNSNTRSKWFRGIGVGFVFSIPLYVNNKKR